MHLLKVQCDNDFVHKVFYECEESLFFFFMGTNPSDSRVLVYCKRDSFFFSICNNATTTCAGFAQLNGTKLSIQPFDVSSQLRKSYFRIPLFVIMTTKMFFVHYVN